MTHDILYTLDFYYVIMTLTLLYHRGHIQMSSNYSTIDMEAEQIVKHLGFLLHYITLTNYYSIQDTFR